MGCFALYIFLLLGLPHYHAQTTAQNTTPTAQTTAGNTTPTGCEGPPVLCCAGLNNSCNRMCYCDEACISIGDCCPDYRSTCNPQLTVFTTPPPGTPTNTSSSTSTPGHNSSSAVSSATSSTETALTDTSTTLDNGSVIADAQAVTLHLKASVLFNNEKNDNVVLEAVSNFISQTLLQQICDGCNSAIRRIKFT